MNRRICFILLALGMLLAFASCGQKDKGEGYFVYQAEGEDGEAAAELVVLDASGKELRRIALPGTPVMLSPGWFALRRHAFYQDYSSESSLLVDVTTGTLQEFTGYGQAQEMARACGGASGWVALCGDQGVYVLHVDTGEVSEIPVELDAENPVQQMYVELVSPDESYFLLRVRYDLWLVPAATPRNARQLGLKATFSQDSQFVLYTRDTETGETQVVKERVDGSATEVLLSGTDIQQAAFIPKRDQLVIVRRDSVTLFSPDSRTERELFRLEDPVRQMWFDPGGKHAAFGGSGLITGAAEWKIVDLETGTTKPLDELTGFDQVYGSPSSRWVLLTDEHSTTDALRIASLDLETATARTHLAAQGVTPGSSPFRSITKDGKRGLFVVTRQESWQLWLVSAEEEEARLLAEAGLVSGSLSPDGRWAALAVWEKEGEQGKRTVRIVPTSKGEEKVIGPGLVPVWVGP